MRGLACNWRFGGGHRRLWQQAEGREGRGAKGGGFAPPLLLPGEGLS